METFYGKKFCGLQGEQTFADVLRPNSQTKKCPTGTRACSPNTSPENAICYKLEDQSKCPITQIMFKNIFTVYDFSQAPYVRQSGFSNGQILVYSAVHIDNLPLQTFQVSYQPCATYGAYANDPNSCAADF